MKITNIITYPVKSLAGVQVQSSELRIMGLKYDRNWMLVDDSNNFITQRQNSKMALITASLSNDSLILSTPDNNSISVPLKLRDFSSQDDDALIKVTVWSEECSAYDEGSEVQNFLTNYLDEFKGSKIRLVRFSETLIRKIPEKHSFGTNAHTGFADGYPFLVISEESLEDLNSRLNKKGEASLPMNRFRPNIVIRGLGAYSEDDNPTLKIANNIELKLVSNCTRCVITTIDQTTAKKSAEPLATFSTYRKNPNGKGVVFGQNAILKNGSGETLKLGSKFTV